jgi:dipeptide/tripeptide permease
MPAGALGKGQQKATAISQSFAMLVYALPIFFGWLADTKTGRFRLIWWGVIICAAAHMLMVSHITLYTQESETNAGSGRSIGTWSLSLWKCFSTLCHQCLFPSYWSR